MTTSLAPYRWLPPGQKPARGSRLRGGHPLLKGLIGYWPFNEGAGPVRSLQPGLAAATFHGNVAWGRTPQGAGLVFPGATGDYVSTPSTAAIRTPKITVAAYARATSDTAAFLVSVDYDGNSVPLSLSAGGANYEGFNRAAFSSYTGATNWVNASAASDYRDGLWHLFVGTYDGATLRIYVDGRLEGSTAQTGLLDTTNTGTLDFGRYNTFYLTGGISWVGLCDRALPAGAIRRLAEQHFGLLDPPGPGAGQWYVTLAGGAALAAGAISVTTPATDTTVGLTVTEATGGTGPYTRQWYRSTSSGFTPDGSNDLPGKTGLTLADTGLTPSTTYYYKVVQTDSAAASVTTTQQAVTTDAAAVAGTEGNLMSVAMGGVILMADATQPLLFQMLSSVNNYTPVPGVTPTVLISKAGDTFATPAGTVSEIAHGWWQVEPDADDRDTTGELLLYAEAAGCAPASVRYQIVAFDPADPVRLGITALPDADAAASAGLPLRNQLPTANENADALLDRSNGIETGLTLRGVLRLLGAGIAGKLSGGGTTTNTIRNVGDTKNRITATVDSNGNRTAVTTDAT